MEMTLGSYRIVIERVPFTPLELRNRYDQLASDWHKLVERLGFTQAYQTLFQQIASDGYFAQIAGDMTVLDCGLGAGDLSLALMATYSRPLIIDGIDISANMVQQAAQRLAAHGNSGRLQQANIQQLPAADNTYDFVMSAHTLEHVSTPKLGLHEMVRVCKPGGLVLTITTKRSFWGRWIQHRWRIQLLERHTLSCWMSSLGLSHLKVYPLSGSLWSINGSIAMIGQVTPKTASRNPKGQQPDEPLQDPRLPTAKKH